MLAYTYSNTALECGTDEAGRGCLAGPVTAAAVINPLFVNEELTNHDVKSFLKQLNDSKQLSEKKRDTLKPYIEKWAYCFAVTHIFNEEIDKINILNASIKAMQECVLKLKSKPSYIIVDGNSPFIPKSGIKN
ncbi:MAG TPA: ribonuclease HII, partial [Flavobacterium sp.]|nr:ribonuclease HII [Flavobacterium sp.]